MPALGELGYTEGKNIAFERKFADGDANKLSELAQELVEHRVDAIVALATPAVIGLHHLALKVADRNALDALHERVAAWPGTITLAQACAFNLASSTFTPKSRAWFSPKIFLLSHSVISG